MLPDIVKKRIQKAYSDWIANNGYKPRVGQKEFIAYAANVFVNDARDTYEHISMIEAGTGTGKTISYLLSGIPVAQYLGKTLVISTSTISLQEQLIDKDLPNLLNTTDLNFSYQLCKGRRNFLCVRNLFAQIYTERGEEESGEASSRTTKTIIGTEVEGKGKSDDGTSETLMHFSSDNIFDTLGEHFFKNGWDGDRSSLEVSIHESDWGKVTTDQNNCSNNRCRYFKDCPYFKVRKSVDQADVLVANHDLLFSDLALGSGAILSASEDSIYVFDEAHHLPSTLQKHFASQVRLDATIKWFTFIADSVDSIASTYVSDDACTKKCEKIKGQCTILESDFSLMKDEVLSLPYRHYAEGKQVYRFDLDAVPDKVAEMGGVILKALTTLKGDVAAFADVVEQYVKPDNEVLTRLEVIEKRLDDVSALFKEYRSIDNSVAARWVYRVAVDSEYECTLHYAPLLTGELFNNALWKKCQAALVTSATLSSSDGFLRILKQLGLPESISCHEIASPFAFSKNASIDIPNMQCNVKSIAMHTKAITECLPEVLEKSSAIGILVLFTSWKQLHDVYQKLPKKWRACILLQSDYEKRQVISKHKAIIDEGKVSVIFGLNSFSEGVDFVGKYCEHVIITRLPFSVPNDPIDEAERDLVKRNQGKPFVEVSVADAALRFKQACGRLLRSETDIGSITVLDDRLTNIWYGKLFFKNLPPYRQSF